MKQVRESKSRFYKYIVDINNYEIIQKIGLGGFGSVYSAKNLKTNETTAAKVINLKEGDENSKIMINREIGIMARCKHPTIVKFKGFSLNDFHNEKNITIFMEYMAKGSLTSFLQKVKKSLLDEAYDNTNRQIILIGIARGMMYLHSTKSFIEI